VATIAAVSLAASQAEFEFEVGPHPAGELAVLAFEVDEQLSRPFSLEVTLVALNDASVDAASLIGEKAQFTVQLGDGSARLVHGIVAQVKRWEEGTGPNRKRYRMQVVPTLWKLGKVQRSRIFQDRTAVEIVEKVLGDGKVKVRKSLSGTYVKRNYCVQYRETDLAFVSRLLEEEGIFFWFEHAQGSHTLVLGDSASAFGTVSGNSTIVFKEKNQLSAAAEYVDQFSASLALRPGKVALRDYNPLTPAVDMNAEQPAQGGDAALEVYDYPGIYLDAGAGKTVAKVRLEEARVEASISRGASVSRRLLPGCVFELDEHPIADLNGKYVVLSISHRGHQPEVLGAGWTRRDDEPESYRNEFVCLKKDVPFRPERKTPRPIIAGAQTALVVGPSGEEIHTDPHGRIKVQFHWDREGKKDDKSSCWVRVSQAWAGPGWGALYLPRIGQEVVVEFLEGNPDRPLVVGSVYNGENPPPIDLPSEKTKSTLRSNSSPGGNGSNELRFEDAAGSEEVYFHAQKDLNIVVENDKTQEIGGNEKLTVKKDRSREIDGNQTLLVKKDDKTTVNGNQAIQVVMNRSENIGGNDTQVVSKDQSISVGMTQSVNVTLASTEIVGAAKTVTVGGAYAVTVGAAMNEMVVGLKSEEIGGAKVETIGGKKTERVLGSRSLQVGGDMSETVGKSRTLKVTKDLIVNVSGKHQSVVAKEYKLKAKEITFSAEETFTMQAGSAKIQLKKNGDIIVKGGKIEHTASGDVIIKGSKIEQN